VRESARERAGKASEREMERERKREREREEEKKREGATEEWAITWNDATENEVLFVKGDFVSWLRCHSSSIDALNWTNPAALVGNKLTDGKFAVYRNEGSFQTSPYIFNETVNYLDAFGRMV
jgi:hypothetical protein